MWPHFHANMECHVVTFTFYAAKTLSSSLARHGGFYVWCELQSYLRIRVLGKSSKVVCFPLDFAMKMTDILKEFYSLLSFHQLIKAYQPFLQVAEPDCLEIMKSNQGSTVNHFERIGTGESRIYLRSCS